MTDDFFVGVTHNFFGAQVHSEEIQDMSTSRVPQARVHQVGDPDGMVVLGLVPAQNGRNVVIRLDPDSAPAPRPFARPLPDSTHALPDVVMFSPSSLSRTGISSMLVPKSRWAAAAAGVRTTRTL